MLTASDLAYLEDEQEAVYRFAGLDPDKAASSLELTRGLGLGAPRFGARIKAVGVLARVRQEWIPFVRTGTSPAKARFVVGHEIAHWWLEERCGARGGARTEARCDALGAFLAVPRAVFLRARQAHGDDVRAIAEELKTTQSIALLRLGETTGRPSAVVRSMGAIVRGEPLRWPSLELASVRRARFPGLRKVRIDDEARRLGLVAA